MRKYCTIIGLLLVVVLPVCAQNWTPQDSLRLRRLLDGEGEIKPVSYTHLTLPTKA